MTDEKILEYIEWCKKQKLSYKEAMTLFEGSYDSETRKRAELLWRAHSGSETEVVSNSEQEQVGLANTLESKTDHYWPKWTNNRFASILILIGVVVVLVMIVFLVIPIRYHEELLFTTSWNYGTLSGLEINIVLKSNYIPIEPTVLNMRATFRGIVNTYPEYAALRVIAYKSFFADKPYAYGDYIDGKLVNFKIY